MRRSKPAEIGQGIHYLEVWIAKDHDRVSCDARAGAGF
jgi:hypothetical protein